MLCMQREETEWAARQLTQGTDTAIVILSHFKKLLAEPTIADIVTLFQVSAPPLAKFPSSSIVKISNLLLSRFEKLLAEATSAEIATLVHVSTLPLR